MAVRVMPALFTRMSTRPHCGGDVGGHLVDRGAFGDVAGEAPGLAAGLADAGGDVVRRLGIHVDHRDLGALAGVGLRDGGADALAGAGDDCDLVLQQHCVVPPLLLSASLPFLPARLEILQRLLELGLHLRRHLGAALVAGIAHAVEPAAAALLAGQFRGAGRVEEDHRQAPRKARPSVSRNSS